MSFTEDKGGQGPGRAGTRVTWDPEDSDLSGSLSYLATSAIANPRLTLNPSSAAYSSPDGKQQPESFCISVAA